MMNSRVMLRSARTIRTRPIRQTCAKRFQHASSPTSSSTNSSGNSSGQGALYGGLAGGTVALVGGYMWYHFSGAKQVSDTVRKTKQYFDSVVDKTKASAPASNEALPWLRQQATFYAGFVPGGSQLVDSAFKDIETVHEKHRDEVDKIINEAYGDLKEVTSKGFSVDAAYQAWNIIEKHMKKISALAGDAAEDILNNHPQIKSSVGGGIDQLRSKAEKMGPEAKQMVDKTWSQIQDILKSGGVNASSIDKIRQLVQDKSQELKKFGDQAWSKGLEEIKPYLDKSPKAKELLEKNKDALKSSNVAELWQQVKQAVNSGDTGDLENFVKQTTEKAKQASGGGGSGGGNTLSSFLSMIPGGSEIMPRLGQLQEIAQNEGQDAEKLVKETIKEIQDVLSKKIDEGKKLADKASSKK